MILKWSDNLKVHPSNEDYNANAAALQKLIPFSETVENSFRHLSDNKTVICVTKNTFDGHLQATFNHTVKKASFTQTNPDYLALTGFGERATAVKLDPKDIFKHPNKRKTVPDFKKMLKCRMVEDMKNLQASQNKVNVDSYAIFPPSLTGELFDEENMDPAIIILKVMNKLTYFM